VDDIRRMLKRWSRTKFGHQYRQQCLILNFRERTSLALNALWLPLTAKKSQCEGEPENGEIFTHGGS